MRSQGRWSGGGGSLTVDDLEAYDVVWREPVRTTYLGHEVISNPPPSSGGVLIAYGLALLDRVARGGPGTAEALASLTEVMREQTRARGGDFATELYAGGLAERLLDADSVAAGVARIAQSLPGAAEHAPLGGTTHVSAIDADGNAASLSSSTGSGSGVVVPGTGIQLNNMLGEYDLVGAGSSRAGPSADEHDGADDRRRGRTAAARRRQCRLDPAARRDHAGDREVVAHGLGVEAAIDHPRIHVEEPHVHCEGGFEAAELDRFAALGYDVVRWRRHNLYFGGTNAVEVSRRELAAAGDARRGGAGLVVSR